MESRPVSHVYRALIAREDAMEREKHTRRSQHWTVLEAWVRELGLGSGAEIGVMRGWTSFHLLDRFPHLTMTLVDQWKVLPNIGESGWDNYAHINMEYQAWRVKTRAATYDGRAKVIHMPSVEAALTVPDNSFDFVFIDGDHTIRGATADIVAWGPKVKPDGWIMGHDWDRPEVRVVLDRLLPGWEGMVPPAKETDKCWRIRKAQTCFAS